MPLRARIDGTDYLAPGMSPAMWARFRIELRAGRSVLFLPCCGKNGFLRTSSRGLQHFVHGRGKACVRSKHESPAILEISTAILRSAISLGLSATADVEIAGHPIPALITVPKKAGRIAFLGYEKHSPRKRMEQVQADLAAAKVRGCWLAQRLPAGLPPDLPAFALSSVRPRGWKVELLKRPGTPLDLFVRNLLLGRWHFRSQAALQRAERVLFHLAPVSCPSCGQRSSAFWLSGRHFSRCGVELDLMDAHRYRPEVLAAVRAFANANSLAMGYVETDPTHDTPEQGALHCPACHAIIPEPIISRARDQKKGRFSKTALIRWKEALSVDVPHWCYSTGRKFC